MDIVAARVGVRCLAFDGHGSDIVAEARDPYASRGGFGRGLVARSPSRV